MSTFLEKQLRGGADISSIVASGAAFAATASGFGVCIVTLIVTSAILLDAYYEEDSLGTTSEHKDMHMKMGWSGIGIAVTLTLFLITMVIVNGKWTEKLFPSTQFKLQFAQ